MRSSSQTVDLFWLIFESAGVTRGNRAGLRVAITETIGATEALAGRASHDLDGDRRHATLDRAGVGNRNFLWLHPAVSTEDVVVDRCGLDFPLQQDRSCDRCHAARRNDLGNAGVVSRRVSIWMLDPESASSSTCASPPIPAPRLCALACFFSSGVADVLASVRRFAVRCDPFSNSYLLRYALADQSRSSSAEKGVRMIRRGNHCVARTATKSDARTPAHGRAGCTHSESLRETVVPFRRDFARSAFGVRYVFASLLAAKRCWSCASVCESESAD